VIAISIYAKFASINGEKLEATLVSHLMYEINVMNVQDVEKERQKWKQNKKIQTTMSIKEIGCCGAYCKTCKPFNTGACKGCKLGYDTGERELSKARCKMKVCCIGKGYDSCADCPEIETCSVINEFYSKNGYKYEKYRQAIEFIRENGYDEFLKIADNWTNAYGKYK
jgi:hypothetical protein